MKIAYKQNKKFNRDRNYKKKNQIEILELKSILTKVKILLE